MLCPAYTDLRSSYLYIQNTSYSNFIEILAETDENKKRNELHLYIMQINSEVLT